MEDDQLQSLQVRPNILEGQPKHWTDETLELMMPIVKRFVEGEELNEYEVQMMHLAKPCGRSGPASMTVMRF